MRILIFAFAIIFGFSQAQAGDPPAVHGMLVFGEKSIYLSHLPMFHSPHDYQVILAADFAASASQIFFTDQKSHPGVIYTLVPKPLVLPDVVAEKKSFQADLYRGHFERGGQIIQKSITVQIKEVLYFHKFDPTASRPLESSYLLFGENGDSWLAHIISIRPDFDQIAKVSVDLSATPAKLPLELNISGWASDKPLTDGSNYAGHSDAGDLTLKNIQTPYLEFDDLSM